MELLVFGLLATIAAVVSSAHVEPILSQSQESGDGGQYAYSYKSGLESKSEHRTPNGRTHGSYSYIDSDGKVQLVKYTAGVDGFHAETSLLPIEGARAVPELRAARPDHFAHAHQPAGVLGDTPEVAAARMQHFAAHAAALAVLPRLRPEPERVHLEPVLSHFQSSGVLGDTPEVEAARRQHAAAHAAARKNLPALPQESLFTHHAPAFPVNPISHNHLLRNDQGIAQFAEDVPRSALGETPEVAAAREAHLAFYSKVKAGLPEDNSARVFH